MLTRNHTGPVQSLFLNVAACAWLARGMWRVSRGRPPWRGPAR